MVKRKYQGSERENASIVDGATAKEAKMENAGEHSSSPGRDPLTPRSLNKIKKEEHEYGSVSAKQVITKAKGKGKSHISEKKQPATRRKNNMIGVLDSIMTMPFSIVCGIAAHLSPGDLLSMARTSKALREFFTMKQSKPFWRVARQGVGLPACPADISEMKFADLIFCKGCYHCGAPRANLLSLPSKLRLCKQCFYKSFAGKAFIKATFNVDDWFFSLLSTSVFEQSNCECYNINEAMAVHKQHQSLKSKPDKLLAFVAVKRQLVSDIMQNAEQVKEWIRLEQQRKEDERLAIIRDRSYNILYNLIGSGYSGPDFKDKYDTDDMRTEWNRLFDDPKPLTDRIWNIIRPKLEMIILRRRITRREVHIDSGSLSLLIDCHGWDCECINCTGGYSSEDFKIAQTL